MIPKFTKIEEGLALLEALDASIAGKFKSNTISQREYKQLQSKLNQRKAILAQMNKLRAEQKPLDQSILAARFKAIYKNNQELISKLGEKQGKILKRLRDRQKTVKNSKNFPY